MERVVLIGVALVCACACGESAPPRTAVDNVVVVPAPTGEPDANEPPVAQAPRTTRVPVTCNGNSQAADREAARKLFRAALHDYERGDYEGAAQKFEQAYELSCATAVLFNLAMCYERLDDAHSAIVAYERYLEADPPPRNAEEARRRLERLRGH